MENTKTKIVAVANQKGGVAKTTSAFNIAAILAQREKKVLMIDLDPQSSLSVSCMKYEYDHDDITITELMSSIINKKTIDFMTAVHHNEPNNIDYIPATITLSGIEVDLCRTRCCEMVLKRVLSNYIGCYDYIIIDCPPSLSNLLYNALSAADMVLIPVLAQEMALSGIPLHLDSIDDIHEYANPDLEILGVFATWTEKNNTMSAEVIESIKAAFNDKYLGSICQTQLQLSVSQHKQVKSSSGQQP